MAKKITKTEYIAARHICNQYVMQLEKKLNEKPKINLNKIELIND